MDAQGDATVYADGTRQTVADGQQLNLGNGETVTRTNQGSLIVRNDDGQGGSIVTTLSDDGQGVNVSTDATNVDLGGYLVNGGNAQPYGQPYAQPFGSNAMAPQMMPSDPNMRYLMNDGGGAAVMD